MSNKNKVSIISRLNQLENPVRIYAIQAYSTSYDYDQDEFQSTKKLISDAIEYGFDWSNTVCNFDFWENKHKEQLLIESHEGYIDEEPPTHIEIEYTPCFIVGGRSDVYLKLGTVLIVGDTSFVPTYSFIGEKKGEVFSRFEDARIWIANELMTFVDKYVQLEKRERKAIEWIETEPGYFNSRPFIGYVSSYGNKEMVDVYSVVGMDEDGEISEHSDLIKGSIEDGKRWVENRFSRMFDFKMKIGKYTPKHPEHPIEFLLN